MSDIAYFTLEDGTTYAKGFFNQNGHSFYVLPEFVCRLEDRLQDYLGPGVEYHMEVLENLPGPNLCPEVP